MKNCKVRKLYTFFAPVLVFVTLLFSCPLFVHGATTVKKLPYDYTWNYLSLDQGVIDKMLLMADTYIDTSDDNLIIFWYEVANSANIKEFCVANVSSVTYPSGKNYDNVDLTTDTLTFNFSESYIGFMYEEAGREVWSNANQYYAPQNFTFFGSGATLVSDMTQVGDQYRHMPLYGTVEVDNELIIGQGEISPTPSDPSEPDPITPDVPTPTWPDFPDNPTVENLLTYIGNLIKAIGTWLVNFGAWLKNALNKIITNIINAIKSVIDNFKSLFKPYIDKVLEFINDFSESFKNFVTDILSLVTDIKTALANVKKFFDYIIDLGTSNGVFSLVTFFSALFVPSQAQISDLFQATDTFALATAGITIWNKIFDIWNTVKNLQAVKILHVPSITYHGVSIGGFDIDFSWYQQFKSYGDGIISAFLYFSYFWFLVFRLPTFIRGQSAIFSDSVTTADAVQEPSHFKGKIGF